MVPKRRAIPCIAVGERPMRGEAPGEPGVDFMGARMLA